MSRLRGRLPRGVVAVALVALAVRLLMLLGTAGYVPGGDPADYDRIAGSVAAGHGWPATTFADPGGPTALRPPAYPLALAGSYALTGLRWSAGRGLGLLLGLATVALIWLLARELFGPRVGRWAGMLAAIYPPLAVLCVSLVAENLFIPLLLGAVLCALRGPGTGNPVRWALGAGVLAGLAVLTRSNGIVVLPALLVAVGVAPGRPRSWRAAAALAAAFAVTLVPWTVRNATEFHAVLPLGTQSGFTLAGQYNAQAAQAGHYRAAWRVPTTVPAFRPLFGRPGQDEAEVDAELRRRGLRYAWEHPGTVLSATGLNALRLVDLDPDRFVAQVSYTEMAVRPGWISAMRNSIVLLLLGAALGAGLLLRRGPPTPVWVWAVPVLLFLSVVPVLGAPRYRVPVDPFLLVLAAVGVVHLRDGIPALRRRATASGA